jgi:hypothetical protein
LSRWAAFLAWLILSVSPAGAAPTLSLVFVSTTGGGSPGAQTIAAAPGDLLTLELRLGADEAGVSSYGISLEFGADLGDELDLVAVVEDLPAGFDVNLTPGVIASQESSPLDRGRVLTFEAATLGDGPTSTSFAVGTIQFRVTDNVATDGPEIAAGFINPGVDGLFDNAGASVSGSVASQTASVDSIDDDRDGVLNEVDNCPHFATADVSDTDLDGRGDECECSDQNGDGTVTVSDLIGINVAIFSPALATPLCDGNNDGLCDVRDILAANVEIFSPGSSTCARQPVRGASR